MTGNVHHLTCGDFSICVLNECISLVREGILKKEISEGLGLS